MTGSQDPRSIVTDSPADRSTNDRPEKTAFRAEPDAPPPVEPDWESLIAAATD